MNHKENYEADNTTFSADAYTNKRFGGISWRVMGWKLESLWRVGCTGCDYSALERENGGGRTIERHSPECPEDAELFTDDEPEYERTERVIAVMYGDDEHFTMEAEDMTPLAETEYCHECGQIGCMVSVPS